MKKIEKREHSLYGIVYPSDMKSLKDNIKKFDNAINEIYSKEQPDKLVRVEFNFEICSKGDVYKLLIAATKLPNGIRCSERRLAVILAVFTNITGNPVCSKRVNAILRSFKRYKKILK